jgi:hypothetical protein
MGGESKIPINQEGYIATYLVRVDEVVNSIRGLGEELNKLLVVQKVLISLLLKYDAKVSTILGLQNDNG